MSEEINSLHDYYIKQLQKQDDEYGTLYEKYNSLQQKVEQLENRRKEAIEYIKEDMYGEPNELYGLVDGEHLLNILNKGSE